jgi:hypothetical protein
MCAPTDSLEEGVDRDDDIYLALPCLALPCLALPCLALPCLALPCLPCLAFPYEMFHTCRKHSKKASHSSTSSLARHAWTRAPRSDRRNTALFCVRALRYLAAPLAAMSCSFVNEDELALWLGKTFPAAAPSVINAVYWHTWLSELRQQAELSDRLRLYRQLGRCVCHTTLIFRFTIYHRRPYTLHAYLTTMKTL